MAYDALRTIMPIAGWPEERAREVEISVGADQVLPTRFRIGAAGAAPRGPSDSRAGQHTHGTHPPPFQIEEFEAAEFADYVRECSDIRCTSQLK